MIAGPLALGRVLRRAPVAPTSAAALLGGHEGYLAFRRIVREVMPEAEDEILAARQPGASRENARVWAFLHRVEAEYFPVYDADEYEQVVSSIQFAPRLGLRPHPRPGRAARRAAVPRPLQCQRNAGKMWSLIVCNAAKWAFGDGAPKRPSTR